jgi:hypothetical protein
MLDVVFGPSLTPRVRLFVASLERPVMQRPFYIWFDSGHKGRRAMADDDTTVDNGRINGVEVNHEIPTQVEAEKTETT